MGKRDYRNLKKGTFVHIYNRGNHLENISFDEEDYAVHEGFLFESVARYKQDLIAYCLLINHFHLQIYIKNPKMISSMMKAFASRSARYFNKKYNTVGKLYQDNYKSNTITDYVGLLYNNRYIHRNPIKHDCSSISNLHNYEWSSYSLYTKETKVVSSNDKLVKSKYVLSAFETLADYKKFIEAKEPMEQFKHISSPKFFKDLTKRLEERW